MSVQVSREDRVAIVVMDRPEARRESRNGHDRRSSQPRSRNRCGAFHLDRERTPFEVTHILQVASVPAGFMRRVTDFDALFAAGALEEVVAPEDATTARAASTVSA